MSRGAGWEKWCPQGLGLGSVVQGSPEESTLLQSPRGSVCVRGPITSRSYILVTRYKLKLAGAGNGAALLIHGTPQLSSSSLWEGLPVMSTHGFMVDWKPFCIMKASHSSIAWPLPRDSSEFQIPRVISTQCGLLSKWRDCTVFVERFSVLKMSVISKSIY